MYISFLKTTDIRFKDGMRDEKYADESTLSERVFDVSKGSNLNPKEATSPRSVWTRTCHDTRAIFFPIRREIESVFRPFANVSFSLITWTRKLMRLCSKIWNISTVYKLKIRFNNLIRRIISMIRRISLQINPSLWQKDSFWNWFHVYAWKWDRNRKRSMTVFRNFQVEKGPRNLIRRIIWRIFEFVENPS